MQQVAGRVALMLFATFGLAAVLSAQQPNVHYWHQGAMPPGAIGSRQLTRGGPLPGYFQPIEIKAPAGALISMAVEGQFDDAQPGPRKVGMLVGAVYRLRVSGIRLAEGLEIFPTIEIIDRTYAPVGMELRFPIPIELSDEDLRLALDGKYVTRVIYLEDPRNALPARENPQAQNWFEVRPGEDPLAVADGLGRPVAILRMGGRLPELSQNTDPTFFFGSPPYVLYSAEPLMKDCPNFRGHYRAAMVGENGTVPFSSTPINQKSPQVKILPPPPKTAPTTPASGTLKRQQL